MRIAVPRKTITLILVLIPLLGKAGNEENVVIVANEDDENSILLARHYQEKRKIPKANLLLISTPKDETISWSTFLAEIYNPLLSELVEKEWIEAVASDLFDSVGRRRFGITGHRIGYLVLCRGVPLKIENDPERLKREAASEVQEAFRINRSSVDAELALMAMSEHAITGLVANPLFRRRNPSIYEQQQVIKVARLDGPSVTAVKGMIDGALIAEKKGLMGRTYVDSGGRHRKGDEWLDTVASTIRPLGYDHSAETSARNFGQTDRFDAPALYFGWYAHSVNGPFLNPGFRFPPGAIAVHIHSTSASTLRDPKKSWCGPFISRGVTATLGNVAEPYLEFTHHLDAFVSAIVEGMNLGDAAYYALPTLSWQAVLLGDPLYQPFKVDLEEQLARLGEEQMALGQYAFIRKMRLLRAEGRFTETIEWGERGFRESPGLALGLELGKAYLASGQRNQAVSTLRFAEYISYFSSDDWLPAKGIADLLVAHGEVRVAVVIYRNLIDSPGLPKPLRDEFMKKGKELARRIGDLPLSVEWSARLSTP